jgi:hypothetical protein
MKNKKANLKLSDRGKLLLTHVMVFSVTMCFSLWVFPYLIYWLCPGPIPESGVRLGFAFVCLYAVAVDRLIVTLMEEIAKLPEK